MLEWGLEKVEAVLEFALSGVAGPTATSLSSSLTSHSRVRTGCLALEASFLGTTRTCTHYNHHLAL